MSRPQIQPRGVDSVDRCVEGEIKLRSRLRSNAEYTPEPLPSAFSHICTSRRHDDMRSPHEPSEEELREIGRRWMARLQEQANRLVPGCPGSQR